MKRKFFGLLMAGVGLALCLAGFFMGRPNGVHPNRPPPPAPAAWIQWKADAGGNDHYFALTPSATNWTAAQKLGESWGGHLAVVSSAQEQDFIDNNILTEKFEHLPIWIGLVRSTHSSSNLLARVRRAVAAFRGETLIFSDDDFEWVTGQTFAYRHWKSGEPNNMPPGESWVAINWEHAGRRVNAPKGTWNDTPINGTTGYGGWSDGPYFGLVEYDPTYPPGSFRTPIILGLLMLLAGLAFLFFDRRKRESAAI